MRGPTTVSTHRGLSPHQFTPMSGAHQALHTMTAASVVLARSGVIGAAVMCELGRWATKYTASIYKNTDRRRLFCDMKHIIKPFVTLLAISLLASACSHKTESSVPTNSTNKPQFTIAAADLAVPAELGTKIGRAHV